MIKNKIIIDKIPAILWGEKSSSLFIAVHGNMSSKDDIPIQLLAEQVVPLGYQVLSFDLPQHGERKKDCTPCKVQNCVDDLQKVMDFAKTKANQISLFACSMGAYFSLLAYKNEDIKKSLFLSPVVDMKKIINNMMTWFNISEQKLEKEKEISTPIGQTLYWDYYQYVVQNPINNLTSPTSILYGENDEISEYGVMSSFSKKFNCNLEIAKNSEHYFHTNEQIEIYKKWLKKTII